MKVARLSFPVLVGLTLLVGVAWSPVVGSFLAGFAIGAVALFVVAVAMGILLRTAVLSLVQTSVTGAVSAALAGTVTWWGMTDAVAVGAALAVPTGMTCYQLAGYAWHRHHVLALKAELEAGDADRRIARVSGWRTAWIMPVLDLLLAYQRPDVVEAILATGRHAALGVRGTWYRASGLLALGRIEDARRIVDSIAPTNVVMRQAVAILGARVSLAEGADATAIVAKLGPMQVHTALAPWRLEVLADACAAGADRDRARELLAELQAATSRAWIEALARSSRPCAAVARDVLEGDATPFR